jgi:hypothetical protein
MAAAAGVAAVTTAALMGPKTAMAGDKLFMNNVPDPILAGKEVTFMASSPADLRAAAWRPRPAQGHRDAAHWERRRGVGHRG